LLGPRERCTRGFRPEAPHRNARNHEFVGGPRCGRERRRIEIGEHSLRVIQPPYEQETPDLEIPRIGGVEPVAVFFESRSRCAELFRGPSQITRGERDLGLGDDAPSAGHGFFRAERTRGLPQENLRSYKIAELGHRNAAKRERSRVVAQRNSLQCAKRITRRKCPCCVRD
jgi:hypothetical protein